MRSVILVGLAVFLIVCAGALGIMWYLQASAAKATLEGWIAQANREHPYISYDSIDTSGFPLDLTISLVNPRFNGRVDEFVRTHLPEMAEIRPMAEWSENFSATGPLSLKINLFSNHYTLTFPSLGQDQGQIAGKDYSVIYQASAPTQCILETSYSGGFFGTMWSLGGWENEEGQENIYPTLVDCQAAPTRVSDGATQADLLTTGPMRLFFSLTQDTSQQQGRVMVTMQEVLYTPLGDELLVLFSKLLAPDSNPVSMNYSALGKQSLNFDASFSGPRDSSAIGLESPLDVQINGLSLSNDLYEYTLKAGLMNKPDGDKRSAKLLFHQEMTPKSGHDLWLRNILRQEVEFLAANEAALVIPALYEATQRYQPQELFDMITPAIPAFESLGKLTQKIDISYDGKADFSEGQISMPAIELTAAPYGISASGVSTLAPQQLFPTANAEVVCSNCLRMIDDMMNYAGRLQGVVFALSPQDAASLQIDPMLVEGVKQLLSALAQKDQAAMTENLSYSIISTPEAGVSINGKPMTQVMELYAQYVLPALTAGEAATSEPVPLIEPEAQ